MVYNTDLGDLDNSQQDIRGINHLHIASKYTTVACKTQEIFLVYFCMKKGKNNLRSHCPVNYGLEAFGDRWALLILRDIVFRGKRTYGEFLKSEEGFATNILASRLERLINAGILQRDGDETDGRKDIYSLTEKGLDLIPMLFEMVLWSEKYDSRSEAKRIMRLVELIKKDNRKISQKVIEQVKRGEAIVREYLS
ncbi:MAG: helix-turn-helix domain-containing protein [Bacteriovoracaceae bacterium]